MELKRGSVLCRKEELEKILFSAGGFYRRFIEGDPAVRELFWMIRVRTTDLLLSPKALEPSGSLISKAVSDIWGKTKKMSSLTDSFDAELFFSPEFVGGDLTFRWELRGEDISPINGEMFDKPEFLSLLVLLNVPLESILDTAFLTGKATEYLEEFQVFFPKKQEIVSLVEKLKPSGVLKVFRGIVEDRYRDYFPIVYAGYDFSDIVEALVKKISFKDIRDLFEKGFHRKETYGGWALSHAGTVLEEVPENLHLECYENLVRAKFVGIKNEGMGKLYTFVNGLLPQQAEFPHFYRYYDIKDLKGLDRYKLFFEEPDVKKVPNKRKPIL